MKTSQKIILGAAGIITVLILATMVIVRDDIQVMFVKEDAWRFKRVQVEKFDRLEFAADYQAEVVSGMDYSVEVAVKDSTRIFPDIKSLAGTLHFSQPKADSVVTNPVVRVRITMPLLKSVWGHTGSEILVRNFQSDSMTVSIEKGCVFKGKENVIKFLTFRSGDALVEWINNP